MWQRLLKWFATKLFPFVAEQAIENLAKEAAKQAAKDAAEAAKGSGVK